MNDKRTKLVYGEKSRAKRAPKLGGKVHLATKETKDKKKTFAGDHLGYNSGPLIDLHQRPHPVMISSQEECKVASPLQLKHVLLLRQLV